MLFMRLVRLSMNGFRVFSERTELDLGGVAACCVVGANSTGKSTMFDAWLWALYGDTAEHSADSIISVGADKTVVSVEMVDASGLTHKFTRERKRGKPASATYIAPNGEAETQTKNVAAMAETVMGCSKDMLKMSCLARQGDLGRFSDLSPSDRRSELVDLLVGDLFDGVVSEVDELLFEKQSVEREAETVLADAEMSAADYGDAKAALKLALGEAKKAETVLTETLDLQARIEKYETDVQRLAEAEKAEKELKAAKQREVKRVAEVERVTVLVGELLEELEALQAEASGLSEKILVVEQEVGVAVENNEQAIRLAGAASTVAAVAKKRLKALLGSNSSECWVCGSELSDDRKQELTRGMKRDILVYKKRRADADESSSDMSSKQNLLRVLKNDLSETNQEIVSVTQRVAEHNARAETLSQHSEDVGVVSDLAAAAEVLRNKVAALPDDVKQAISSGGVEHEITMARRSVSAAQQQVGEARARVAEAKTAKAALDKLRAAADEAAVSKNAAGLLKDWLKPSGIPHLLMARRTAIVEKRVNAVLGSLKTVEEDRILEMRFRTSNPNSGNPALGIEVNLGDDGWMDYSHMSGGMRSRVDFSLRVALSQQAGVHCTTFIVDEGAAMLDGQGVDSLLDAVVALIDAGLVEQVFLVTHDERLKGRLPHTLEVGSGEQAGMVSLIAA